ncbi:MAG: hypothetical protein HYV02_01070 [Deltaproteobacteria bacterium]|nr:hypothetical protein [Deltaproteobacteria bacterium]
MRCGRQDGWRRHCVIPSGAPGQPDNVSGIQVRGRRLTWNGRRLRCLGAGSLGKVFEHPHAPSAVIKLAIHSFGMLMMGDGQSREATIEEDAIVSGRLAGLDVGPRSFGLHRLGPDFLLVKERVYGVTLAALARSRAIDMEVEALVDIVVRRMAAAGLTSEDLLLGNFMMGRTMRDETVRVYCVDGNMLRSLPAGSDAERVQQIYDTPVAVRVRFHPYDTRDPLTVSYESFATLLAQGRVPDPASSWWHRFKHTCERLFEAAEFPSMR